VAGIGTSFNDGFTTEINISFDGKACQGLALFQVMQAAGSGWLASTAVRGHPGGLSSN
jgi:hypothetical protein